MTAIPSAAAFHRHLDTCAQCRNNPFKLCPVGHALLTGAANSAPPKMVFDIEFMEMPSAACPPMMEWVE